MTRIEMKRQQVTYKLNRILSLTHEVLNLQEEIGVLENEKDFSRTELIDAGGFTQNERKRHQALFGPLAYTVKKLRRTTKEQS